MNELAKFSFTIKGYGRAFLGKLSLGLLGWRNGSFATFYPEGRSLTIGILGAR